MSAHTIIDKIRNENTLQQEEVAPVQDKLRQWQFRLEGACIHMPSTVSLLEIFAKDKSERDRVNLKLELSFQNLTPTPYNPIPHT